MEINDSIVYSIIGASGIVIGYMMVVSFKKFMARRKKVVKKVLKKVVKKEPKKETKEEIHTSLNHIKENHFYNKKPFLSKERWKNFIISRLKKKTKVMINMELVSGRYSSFYVGADGDSFKYNKKTYLFDDDLKYYNTDLKMYCFDYHENFSLPIKRKVPYEKLRTALESSPTAEIEYASNPATLERFIVARIAEGILKGQQLDDWMKQIRLILIINVLATIILLLLYMQKTGMLDSLTSAVGV